MTDFAQEYASGLYALAKEEAICGAMLSQMHTLVECFSAEPKFLQLLSNMSLKQEERLQILDDTLRKQVHLYLLNFLKILLKKNALHEFAACEEVFRDLYYKDFGIVDACVTTSVTLSPSQVQRLTEKLEAMTGKRIALTQKVDTSLLGGVLLEMDGKRYDNTLSQRLDSLRRMIAGET